MKWVGFGASAASTEPCVSARGGIVQLWWSMDVLVVVTAITPWSSCFINFSKERSPH
jgi:hypothetical protein